MIPIDVVVLDYGVGNGNSVASFLRSLGCHVIVSSHVRQLEMAKAVFIPGVGAFNTGMKNLLASQLIAPLNEFRNTNKLVVGICLGMQIFAERSDENGSTEGLGWIPGEVRHLSNLKQPGLIPHIGWNDVRWRSDRANLLELTRADKFYFDHSYYFDCHDRFILADTPHESNFPAAIRRENIVGFQFHPEKSQLSGKKLMVQLLDEFAIERRPLCLLEE